MIGTALQFVAQQLNQVVCQKLHVPTTEERVILGSIVGPDGSLLLQNKKNVLVVDLVSIQQADYTGQLPPSVRGGVVSQKSPTMYLSFTLLLAAFFEQKMYAEGLNRLNLVMDYLQGHRSWDASSSMPGLPPGIERLAFEIENLDYHEQSHLWGIIGAKYLPSVFYKMKLLPVDSDDIAQFTPVVKAIGPNVKKKE